mgnify:CR=1 FL=1
MASNGIINGFSVDVEDWYQVADFMATVKYDDWDGYDLYMTEVDDFLPAARLRLPHHQGIGGGIDDRILAAMAMDEGGGIVDRQLFAQHLVGPDGEARMVRQMRLKLGERSGRA